MTLTLINETTSQSLIEVVVVVGFSLASTKVLNDVQVDSRASIYPHLRVSRSLATFQAAAHNFRKLLP